MVAMYTVEDAAGNVLARSEMPDTARQSANQLANELGHLVWICQLTHNGHGWVESSWTQVAPDALA